MRRVALVRHAATDWSGVRFCGRSDPPLSERGRSQLDGLAAEVARSELAAARIRSSPARRAVETAGALSRALGAPVELDERLWEVDFGAVDGLTFDEIQRDHPALAALLLARRYDVDWPDGERASDVVARLTGVARELERERGDAIVVAHSGIIRGLVWILEPERGVAQVPPAGWLVLERGDGGNGAGGDAT